MFRGPVKAELISGALEGLQADFTLGYKKSIVSCPDCGGSTEDTQPACATCKGTGSVEIAEAKLPDEMPEHLRQYVQEYKVGRQGRLIPVFMPKVKLLETVIQLTGADKPQTRTPWNTAMTSEEQAQREAEIAQSVALLNKDTLIKQLMDIAADPMATANERLNAIDKIAVLRGYKTDGDNGGDDEPLPAAPWER